MNQIICSLGDEELAENDDMDDSKSANEDIKVTFSVNDLAFDEEGDTLLTRKSLNIQKSFIKYGVLDKHSKYQIVTSLALRGALFQCTIVLCTYYPMLNAKQTLNRGSEKANLCDNKINIGHFF